VKNLLKTPIDELTGETFDENYRPVAQEVQKRQQALLKIA
jgi:hypothetical protein